MGLRWAFGGLSVAYIFYILYNNASKIFGIVGVLYRRLENLERKGGRYSMRKWLYYNHFRMSVFLLKKVFARRRLCRKSLANNEIIPSLLFVLQSEYLVRKADIAVL